VARPAQLNRLHDDLHLRRLADQHRQYGSLQRTAVAVNRRSNGHLPRFHHLRAAQEDTRTVPPARTLVAREVGSAHQRLCAGILVLVFLLELLAELLQHQCRELQLGVRPVYRVDGRRKYLVLHACEEDLRGPGRDCGGQGQAAIE